jgi:hypothetical protein
MRFGELSKKTRKMARKVLSKLPVSHGENWAWAFVWVIAGFILAHAVSSVPVYCFAF